MSVVWNSVPGKPQLCKVQIQPWLDAHDPVNQVFQAYFKNTRYVLDQRWNGTMNWVWHPWSMRAPPLSHADTFLMHEVRLQNEDSCWSLIFVTLHLPPVQIPDINNTTSENIVICV